MSMAKIHNLAWNFASQRMALDITEVVVPMLTGIHKMSALSHRTGTFESVNPVILL